MNIIPIPPNNAALTRVGIDYLKLQFQASLRGSFGGFRLGSSSALIINSDATDVAGDVVHTGTNSDIFYQVYNSHEVILQCTVEHDKGDFDIGSIAILSDTGVPVFVGRLEYQHRKMASITDKAGGRFTYQLRFMQYRVQDYWDFTGMIERYTQLPTFTGSFDDVPQRPVLSPNHSQVQTDDLGIGPTGRNGYVLLPRVYGLTWTANPFAMRLDDAEFHQFSGGYDGDNHLYTYP